MFRDIWWKRIQHSGYIPNNLKLSKKALQSTPEEILNLLNYNLFYKKLRYTHKIYPTVAGSQGCSRMYETIKV